MYYVLDQSYIIQLKYVPNRPVSFSLLASSKFPDAKPRLRKSIELFLPSSSVDPKSEPSISVELLFCVRFQIDSNGSTKVGEVLVVAVVNTEVLLLLLMLVQIVVELLSNRSGIIVNEFSLLVEFDGTLEPSETCDEFGCAPLPTGVDTLMASV